MAASTTEAIFADAARVVAEFEIAPPNLIDSAQKADAAAMQDAIVPAIDVKQVHLRIASAEGDLPCVMQIQIRDRAAAAHQKPAPDQRTALANPFIEERVNCCTALSSWRSAAAGHRSPLTLTHTIAVKVLLAGREIDYASASIALLSRLQHV